MKLDIHPEAAEETIEAALFYKERAPEISLRFRTEVYIAIERACSQPLFYRMFENGLRKVKVAHFPYFVVFRITEGETLQVLAVAHGSREPGYWRHRA